MREASPVASPVASEELKTRSILTIQVGGSGPVMALPTSLPVWNPPVLPIARTRQLNYTVQRGSNGNFISFGVDGLPFDPQNEPYQIKLGTAEEWTIYNSIDNKLSDHVH
jgi:hypothetical protein